jgi:hypothetical protein
LKWVTWTLRAEVWAMAENGLAVIARFLSSVSDVKGRNEIERELTELRTTLDSAGHQLRREWRLYHRHQSESKADS